MNKHAHTMISFLINSVVYQELNFSSQERTSSYFGKTLMEKHKVINHDSNLQWRASRDSFIQLSISSLKKRHKHDSKPNSSMRLTGDGEWFANKKLPWRL